MPWEKVKPKGRCQCHASSDGEGQSPNYLFHGVTLFWLCRNCQKRAKKSVIAITFWSFSVSPSHSPCVLLLPPSLMGHQPMLRAFELYLFIGNFGIGDDVQSNQVRECLRHAEDCAQQAASQTNPKLRRDYLIIGAYWLKLSQELSERPLP